VALDQDQGGQTLLAFLGEAIGGGLAAPGAQAVDFAHDVEVLDRLASIVAAFDSYVLLAGIIADQPDLGPGLAYLALADIGATGADEADVRAVVGLALGRGEQGLDLFGLHAAWLRPSMTTWGV